METPRSRAPEKLHRSGATRLDPHRARSAPSPTEYAPPPWPDLDQFVAGWSQRRTAWWARRLIACRPLRLLQHPATAKFLIQEGLPSPPQQPFCVAMPRLRQQPPRVWQISQNGRPPRPATPQPRRLESRIAARGVNRTFKEKKSDREWFREEKASLAGSLPAPGRAIVRDWGMAGTTVRKTALTEGFALSGKQ